MRLNKYSQAKDGSTVIGAYTPSSSSSPSSPSASPSIDRDLWGQPDTGDDIDGDITVNGNIYAGEVSYNEDDDDDTPPASTAHSFPTESGNIFAQNSVESPVVTVSRTLNVYNPDSGNFFDVGLQMGVMMRRMEEIQQTLNSILERL